MLKKALDAFDGMINIENVRTEDWYPKGTRRAIIEGQDHAGRPVEIEILLMEKKMEEEKDA